MTELSVGFPENQDQDYEALASRRVGELALSRLAPISYRDYVWSFDAQTEVWNHVLGGYVEVIDQDESGDVISRSTEMAVPLMLVDPPSSDASFYHLRGVAGLGHLPAGVRLKNQLPSSSEVATCIVLGVNGYRDFRIVTPHGVTTMKPGKLDPEDGSIRVKGFELGWSVMEDWISEYGIVQATKQAIGFFDEHFGDVIDVSFREIADA